MFAIAYVCLSVSAHFENCDYVVNLLGNEGTAIVNPGAFLIFLHNFGFVGYFRAGTSCRYRIQVPYHYAVRLECDMDVAITVSHLCHFYVTFFFVVFH